MCNQACLSFVEKYLKPEDIAGKNILEVGSLDINGSARYYVEKHNPSKYLGTDIVKGKGVDEICDVQHLAKKYGENSFDIVICTEVLEHVQDWKAAIENMISVLRTGGKLIITTRSPGFPVHNYPSDYWRYTKENFRQIFSDMENVIIEDDPEKGVLFYGVKGVEMRKIPNVKLDTPIPFDLVIGHCSFIPHTGYAYHAREYFTRLADHLPVRIRNFAYTPDLSHLSEKQKNMVIHQTWTQPPYQLGQPFNRNFYHRIINIILLETNHYYYYENYDGPKVAYNVWESTRQPEQFFQKLLEFDMMWVPTNWQRWCTIEQGYPADKIFVVPEGVNGNFFCPGEPPIKVLNDERFKFLLCGRWDYRKSTAEILRAFIEEFKKDEPVDIICQIENPFKQDDYNTTQERLAGHKLIDPRIKIVTGLPENDDLYLSYLRSCHCLVTCSRSEGWNLPLCVIKGSEVVTSEGITPIENINVDDNVITHLGRERKVIEKFERKIKEDIISIRLWTDYEPINVTNEHPILTIKREKIRGKFRKYLDKIVPEWVRASDIKKGDLIVRTTIPQKYNKNIIIDMKDIDNRLLYDNDYVWYNTGYNGKGEQKKYKRFINLSDLSYVFGWYIAEGCSSDKSRVNITVNIKEKDVVIKWLEDIKEIFGAVGSYTEYPTKIQARVSSTLLSKFFSFYCGEKADQKKIPYELLFGDVENLRIVIDEYAKSNGHITDRNISCSTISKELARQLVLANQRLGRKASIRKSVRRENKREDFVIWWSRENENYRHSNYSWFINQGLAILVKDVKNIFYDGPVYNFEVEEDESYLLCNVTVHNCQGIATGIPTIASNWGAQLEFCKDASHLVNIKELRRPENVFMQKDTPGEWAEPDYEHLKKVMREIYENYEECKKKALKQSEVVRRDFTWEKAVDKSVEILKQFGSGKSKGKKVETKRLHLGCGGDIKVGYINADKFDKRADVNFDAKEIPYDDQTFDEVYSSHLMEHFNKYEVPVVFKECYRILNYGGKLVFEVPDFEWVVKTWLGKTDEEKWGFHLDTIFGLQTNEGEQHKVGFTRGKLKSLLAEAGFRNIVMKDIWSHDQQCIYVEAQKRHLKEIFIIDTYPDLPEKEELTIGMIEEVKDRGYPVLLVSHYPISTDIQKMVNYYVYDANNIMSDGWNLNYWFQNEEVKIVSQYETKYHGAACYSSLVNAVRVLSQYDIAHFIEFDIDADLDLYLSEAGKKLEKYKLVGFMYDEEQNTRKVAGMEPTYGIISNLFSFDIKWMNERMKDISSWSDYNKVIAEASEKTKIRIDLIFENWLYNYFKANADWKDIFLFTKNDMKYKIIKERNLFDQGKKEPIERVFLSETADNKVVQFTVNTETKKWSYKIVEREENKDYTKTNFKFKDGRLICKRWNPSDDKGWMESEDKIAVTFIDGVKVEITGNSSSEYDVGFFDKDVNLQIHRGKIKPNHWIAPNARYYVNWQIMINKDGKPYKSYELDLVNNKVLVYFDSKALGDTLAWFPYAKIFKEKHGCKNFYVSTFWNRIFEKEYPDLKFVEPGQFRPDIYYNVGCRDNDYHSNKNNWRLVPLQKVATDYLGLEYEEVRPKVTAEKKNVKKPYVTISEHSTLLCKRWHYPLGWQTVVDALNDRGYGVMVVSKEPTQLKNIIDRTNSTIQQTINNIYNSRLFIGVGSGLSWLAWALNIPVILISGFSEPWSEMNDCIRISPPEGICRGCYNDIKHPYDRGNWTWCPRNKKYECSRTIKPEVIIEQIDKIL